MGFVKGHIGWNTGLNKETDVRVRHQSENVTGFKHRQIIKDRIGLVVKLLWKDPTYKLKQSIARKKSWENNPQRHKETAERSRRLMTKEKKFKMLKGLSVRPTSYEKKVMQLCEKYDFPFIYSGNGQAGVMIGGKFPDFMGVRNYKLIIETYCRWYKIKRFGSVEYYEKERVDIYGRFGYKVLFLSDDVLYVKNWEDLAKEKIEEFLRKEVLVEWQK